MGNGTSHRQLSVTYLEFVQFKCTSFICVRWPWLLNLILPVAYLLFLELLFSLHFYVLWWINNILFNICWDDILYRWHSMWSGQKGNLTERVTASIISLLMIFAVFVGVLYLLLWQTYVLWLEAVLIGFEMAFLVFEIVVAFITVATFARYVVLRLWKELCHYHPVFVIT